MKFELCAVLNWSFKKPRGLVRVYVYYFYYQFFEIIIIIHRAFIASLLLSDALLADVCFYVFIIPFLLGLYVIFIDLAARIK